MARRARPVHEFRVTPTEKGRIGFMVRVFKTVEQMRAFLEADSLEGVPGGHWSNTQAACRSWKILEVYSDGSSRTKPCMGDICFHLDRSGIGTIAHECLHATMAYLRRRNLVLEVRPSDATLIDGNEEYTCWIHGRLVAEVVRKGYDCGWLRQ